MKDNDISKIKTYQTLKYNWYVSNGENRDNYKNKFSTLIHILIQIILFNLYHVQILKF